MPDEIASKWLSVLANRARTGRFYGHPSALEDLLEDPRLLWSVASMPPVSGELYHQTSWSGTATP
jgi:hypothetical protein